MNEYNFKKFQSTGSRYESRITITASNSIGFPTRFYTDNKLDSYKYVVLFYDEDNKAIGIQFTSNEDEPHKFTLIKSKTGYGATVVSTSFFKKYKIDPKKHKGKYEWEKVKTDFGLLYVIKLNQTKF